MPVAITQVSLCITFLKNIIDFIVESSFRFTASPSARHMHSLLTVHTAHQVYVCYNWWNSVRHHCHPMATVYTGVHYGHGTSLFGCIAFVALNFPQHMVYYSWKNYLIILQRYIYYYNVTIVIGMSSIYTYAVSFLNILFLSHLGKQPTDN